MCLTAERGVPQKERGTVPTGLTDWDVARILSSPNRRLEATVEQAQVGDGGGFDGANDSVTIYVNSNSLSQGYGVTDLAHLHSSQDSRSRRRHFFLLDALSADVFIRQAPGATVGSGHPMNLGVDVISQ